MNSRLVAFALVLSLLATHPSISQPFYSTYTSQFGQAKFDSISNGLNAASTDSLKSLLEFMPIILTAQLWMGDMTGASRSEEGMSMRLIVYVGANILAQRGAANENVWACLGLAEDMNSECKQAIEHYTLALKGNLSEDKPFPRPSVIYSNRGWCRFELGNYQGAIDDLTQAISFAPKYSDYYVERGRANTMIKKYDAAMADFAKAIELNERDPDPYFYRATCYLALQRKELACLDFNKALELRHKEAQKMIQENCK